MKKTLLSIASLTLGLATTQAQTTISATSMPSVGDMKIMVVDSMPTVSEGNAGAGQSWDLTGIAAHVFDTTYFLAPTNDFPTANMGIGTNAQLNFVNVSNNGVDVVGSLIGFFGTPPRNIHLDPVQTILTFPSALDTAFIDTSKFGVKITGSEFGFAQVDSIWNRRTSYLISEIDGDGEVTTPGGTYSCVRQYKVEESMDSIFVYVTDQFTATALNVTPNQWDFIPPNQFLPVNPILNTTHTYTWLSDTATYTIAEVELNDNDTVISAQYQYNNNLLAFVDGSTQTTCDVSCDGSGTISGTGGTGNYSYAWAGGATTATATGLCAGATDVTITDGSSSTVLTVNVDAGAGWSSSVSVSGQDATAIANGGVSPYTYNWDDGQTTETAVSMAQGNHQVTITDAMGCTSTATTYVSNIEDVFVASGLSVYPNPTTGSFTVVSKNGKIDNVEVYNALGMTVATIAANNSTTLVNLSEQAKGIYLVKVTTNNGVAIKQVMLTK